MKAEGAYNGGLERPEPETDMQENWSHILHRYSGLMCSQPGTDLLLPGCFRRSAMPTHPLPGKQAGLTHDTTSESQRTKQSLNWSVLGGSLANKLKTPQNNTGKHPTSVPATRTPTLSQAHNNSRSRARYCHIFSADFFSSVQ